MATGVSGPEALRRFDGAIAELRRMVSDSIAAAEGISGREAEVRKVQVEAFRELALIRLNVIDDLEAAQLDRLHAAAKTLLDKHDEFVASSQQELDSASARIADLEKKRAAIAAEHEAAVKKYETEVVRVAGALKADQAYLDLSQASQTAAAIAARASQKLKVAREDIESKGAPFKSDKLFMYLWQRKFRTPEYRAGLITRLLDGWVASLCKYDQAWMNYQRLSDLPLWLEDHAVEQDRKASAALKALEDAEHAALEKAGTGQMRAKAESLLQEIRTIDKDIDRAEAEHQQIAEKHTRAVQAEEGPAREARRVLEEGLQRASFNDLRRLAAETLSLDDDRLVDRLAKLRTEEMQLELEAQKLAGQPDRIRVDLGQMEELRRRFKQARYDSGYALFASAAIDEVLTGILRGQTTADEAFNFLQRAVRRIEPQAEPGFGGQHRSDTIGLPDVLGDIVWEIAKESMRGGRGYRGGSINFPSGGGGRRSPRIDFPSGGSGSRGGGFGGGGGGKRGGGFRTGGGF
jgi:hypothetical protein